MLASVGLDRDGIIGAIENKRARCNIPARAAQANAE
jgi:hypothetical protein